MCVSIPLWLLWKGDLWYYNILNILKYGQIPLLFMILTNHAVFLLESRLFFIFTSRLLQRKTQAGFIQPFQPGLILFAKHFSDYYTYSWSLWKFWPWPCSVSLADFSDGGFLSSCTLSHAILSCSGSSRCDMYCMWSLEDNGKRLSLIVKRIRSVYWEQVRGK